MTPSSYRKKPVVVEVVGPLTRDNAAGIAHWCGGSVSRTLETVAIAEGAMFADLGDYVIRGDQGEFYPCKPDVFAQAYEPAEDSPS